MEVDGVGQPTWRRSAAPQWSVCRSQRVCDYESQSSRCRRQHCLQRRLSSSLRSKTCFFHCQMSATTQLVFLNQNASDLALTVLLSLHTRQLRLRQVNVFLALGTQAQYTYLERRTASAAVMLNTVTTTLLSSFNSSSSLASNGTHAASKIPISERCSSR